MWKNDVRSVRRKSFIAAENKVATESSSLGLPNISFSRGLLFTGKINDTDQIIILSKNVL